MKRETLALTISTVVLGTVVGFGSLVLGLFLDFFELVFLRFEETSLHPFAWTISPGRRFLSLAIGGTIAAVVWWWMRRRMAPTVGIPVAIQGRAMPVRTTIVHVLTQIFYVSIGGSIGRELAPRELGAMIAQQWSDFLARLGLADLNENDRRLLVAAAAGAGFAGVYIAPITGTLFAIEILLKKPSVKAIAVSFPMSLIAMAIGAITKGYIPYYRVGTAGFSWRLLVLALVLAPVCGVVGALLLRAVKWAGRRQARDNSLLWRLPLVAVLTGLIAMPFPQIMGNGRALAQAAISVDSAATLRILLLGALAKGLVTTLNFRAGADGGTLTPSIAIGATLGATAGMLASLVVPGLPLWQCALVGAAGMLAASQQAPLMAMFMLFEVCHLSVSALAPLGVSVLLALFVSRQFLGWQSHGPKRAA